MKTKVSFFWFRRDLRFDDNRGLSKALQSGNKIIPLFIFDEEILNDLPKEDARVTFIYQTLEELNSKKEHKTLIAYNSEALLNMLELFEVETLNKRPENTHLEEE